MHLALEAAEVLQQEGIELEVVDLRTLIPLDKETLYASVRKTSKAIILHEDNKTGGIGAEISRAADRRLFRLSGRADSSHRPA